MMIFRGTTRTFRNLSFLLGVAGLVSGQARLDLGRQAKDADFSGFFATRPAETGALLPGSCGVGDLFFLTTAPAGQNLYGCTSANSWTPLGSGGGGTSGGGAGLAAQLGDFAATNTSSSVQTLGQGCSASTPCQIRTGSTIFTMIAGVSATLSGTHANGTIYWYLTASQLLVAGHNSAATLTCSAGCTAATGITGFPPDSVPLWQTTFTANVFDTIAPATMDKRAFLSRNVVLPGPGVSSITDPNTGIQTLSTDPTSVPRYTTGSGAPVGNCTAGRDLYIDTGGAHLYFCSSTNVWTQAH